MRLIPTVGLTALLWVLSLVIFCDESITEPEPTRLCAVWFNGENSTMIYLPNDSLVRKTEAMTGEKPLIKNCNEPRN